jgi:hypothetical protein
MRYRGCQDIRYTSPPGISVWAERGGSPEGDWSVLPTRRGITHGRVVLFCGSISRTYMCR